MKLNSQDGTIIIGFAHRPARWAIGARVLEAAERVPFSHCYIEIVQGRQRQVFEAVWPKSREISKEEWLKHYEAVHEFRFQADDFELHEAVEILNQLVGIRYSVPQLVLIGTQFVFVWTRELLKKLFPTKLRPDFLNGPSWDVNGSREIICTELLADFMSKMWGVTWKEDTDFVSLRDVLETTFQLWREHKEA